MVVSIVIPTINREKDLLQTISSIFLQSTLPDEIIIVDQSPSDDSRTAAESLFSGRPDSARDIHLVYIHDTQISGSATARNVGIDKSSGDIILFLDDDVILEHNFIAEILRAYKRYPNVAGVAGTITNEKPPDLLRRAFNKVFHLGVFMDERMIIYWNFNKYSAEKVFFVSKFTGCLMSFKKSVLKKIRFDENYVKYSLGEDLDISYRISKEHDLIITPQARLQHLKSPLNRYGMNAYRVADVCAHYYIFKKNLDYKFINRVFFLWLNIGFIVKASAFAVKERSLSPVLSCFSAYKKIFNNLKDCDFLVSDALKKIN